MIKRLTDDPLTLAATVPEAQFPAGLQAVMDRALARWPNDRYDTAAHFARDVSALAGALTGTVDTEGSTQLFKRASGSRAPTVPATRVDPAAAAERKKSGATPAAPTVAASAPTPVPVVSAPARRFPVLPVAATVMLLVVGGAAFAFRHQLFGGGKGAPTDGRPDSVPVQPGPGPAGTTGAPSTSTNPGTAELSHQTDSSKVVIPPAGGGKGKPDTIRRVTPGTTPGTTALANPATGGGARPAAKIVVPVPNLDDIVDSLKRPAARQKAEAIYNRSDVADSTRAEAASLVAQALLEDGRSAEARGWFGKALQLKAKPSWQEMYDKLQH